MGRGNSREGGGDLVLGLGAVFRGAPGALGGGGGAVARVARKRARQAPLALDLDCNVDHCVEEAVAVAGRLGHQELRTMASGARLITSC
jgi:hypothetical protein